MPLYLVKPAYGLSTGKVFKVCHPDCAVLCPLMTVWARKANKHKRFERGVFGTNRNRRQFHSKSSIFAPVVERVGVRPGTISLQGPSEKCLCVLCLRQLLQPSKEPILFSTAQGIHSLIFLLFTGARKTWQKQGCFLRAVVPHLPIVIACLRF